MVKQVSGSLLPLTDPCNAMPHVHRVVHRCGRSIW